MNAVSVWAQYYQWKSCDISAIWVYKKRAETTLFSRVRFSSSKLGNYNTILSLKTIEKQLAPQEIIVQGLSFERQHFYTSSGHWFKR